MKRLLGFLYGSRGGERDAASPGASEAHGPHDRPQLYRIDFDMMLKGSIYQRRRGPVRQYGVTVNGSTRLVTSGDMVDEETFHALVVAGAVRPPQNQPFPKPPKPAVLDRTAVEGDDY